MSPASPHLRRPTPTLWKLVFIVSLALTCMNRGTSAQEARPSNAILLGPYEYETKPEGEAFRNFNPRKAPAPGALLMQKGDRLAIVGDSITEQKMYSCLIETYLTACVPELEVTVRQYGWSGEKTDGFLHRMDNDCLRFSPTIATVSYGMNDSRYRPFDVTNGRWYEDHYRAIVRKFKDAGARVVVGSPGCAGKIATWVQSRSGTLEQHNIHLCALRDIATAVAESEQVAFADVFWPMYQAQVSAPSRYPGDGSRPYEVAGRDGIHPSWAGHVIMAYAYLKALGLDGDLGVIHADLSQQQATGTPGHHIDHMTNGEITVTSTRYPFCADGPADRDNSIRSGMTLVPFNRELNRFVLKVSGGQGGLIKVTWGGATHAYSPQQAADGINLADEFPSNPFCDAFSRVQTAVAEKQAYETKQIKQVFHGKRGQQDMEAAVRETENERTSLAAAIAVALRPVTHTILIEQ